MLKKKCWRPTTIEHLHKELILHPLELQLKSWTIQEHLGHPFLFQNHQRRASWPCTGSRTSTSSPSSPSLKQRSGQVLGFNSLFTSLLITFHFTHKAAPGSKRNLRTQKWQHFDSTDQELHFLKETWGGGAEDEGEEPSDERDKLVTFPQCRIPAWCRWLCSFWRSSNKTSANSKASNRRGRGPDQGRVARHRRWRRFVVIFKRRVSFWLQSPKILVRVQNQQKTGQVQFRQHQVQRGLDRVVSTDSRRAGRKTQEPAGHQSRNLRRQTRGIGVKSKIWKKVLVRFWPAGTKMNTKSFRF